MKNIIGIVVVYLLVGCGDSYYDNIIGITPMDNIIEDSKESSKNIFDNLTSGSFDNNSTVLAKE